MELQLYIKNIARRICIVELLSARAQDHQWNTIITYCTISTIRLYTNKKNSTSLWYSPNFQSIIQTQPNIYSPLCIHQPTHAPTPLRTIKHPLKLPHLLFRHFLIWSKLNLPLQSKNYLPVLIITMSNKIKNPRK